MISIMSIFDIENSFYNDEIVVDKGAVARTALGCY